MAGRLEGLEIVACAFEFRFLGGSMGSVVGERFARAAEFCIEQRRPLVCFSSSGGARMQEGLLSLLQMSKTSAALARLAAARLPFISVLTDPTTGGVSASLAMLGDLNIAEPRALIGFAGPRVIQQTVRETLPEGFQRSEFLLEHGAIDMIVDRRDLRERIAAVLALLMHQPPRGAPARVRPDVAAPVRFPRLEHWLEWQQSAAPAGDRPRPRARRARARPHRLAQPARPVITVGGTNGKGSCVAMLEAMLRAGGYRVATFTSPHLVRYHERIRLDGRRVVGSLAGRRLRAHRRCLRRATR